MQLPTPKFVTLLPPSSI